MCVCADRQTTRMNRTPPICRLVRIRMGCVMATTNYLRFVCSFPSLSYRTPQGPLLPGSTAECVASCFAMRLYEVLNSPNLASCCTPCFEHTDTRCFSTGGKIYLQAITKIRAGDELLTWYGKNTHVIVAQAPLEQVRNCALLR